ncbi:hypothetical protein QE152_g31995 [Popillia japonica]|uniref:Uncharacterized protein n=1 Tax=Popillia japonica TaxID=7064 RepID=A0AAW1J038_POPJA
MGKIWREISTLANEHTSRKIEYLERNINPCKRAYEQKNRISLVQVLSNPRFPQKIYQPLALPMRKNSPNPPLRQNLSRPSIGPRPLPTPQTASEHSQPPIWSEYLPITLVSVIANLFVEVFEEEGIGSRGQKSVRQDISMISL